MLISAYIDGEANDAERADIEEHLHSCDECLNFHNTLMALKHLLASHRLRSPSGNERAALLKLIREAPPRRRGWHAHKCSKAQRKMLELIDEKLSNDEAAMLLADIARCDACTAAFSQWERYAAIMAELAGVPIPHQRKAELLERLGEERLARGFGIGRLLPRLVAGALIACAIAMTTVALLRHQTESARITMRHEQRTPGSLPKTVESMHGKTTQEKMAPSIGLVTSPLKPQQMANRPIRQAELESRSRERIEAQWAKSTPQIAAAPASATSRSGEAKVSVAKRSMPTTVSIKREGITPTTIAMRPYKPAELLSHEEGLPTAQMLVTQRKETAVNEMPTVESHYRAVESGNQQDKQLKVSVTLERLYATSPQKDLPKHGIGIATGEHVNDELYMHGGLEEFLKHKVISREHALAKFGEHPGQHWGILIGAAFQPRPEVEELERVRERMLGYQNLVEQSRFNDTFMGANQNRMLCIKLFRLGIKW